MVYLTTLTVAQTGENMKGSILLEELRKIIINLSQNRVSWPRFEPSTSKYMSEALLSIRIETSEGR
jgi:hypothetical protein